MESLFTTGHDALAARLRTLTADTPPRWGKMDAAQMCSHCLHGLRVATGELQARPLLLGRLFGRFARRVALGDKPFGRNLPTGPDFRRREPLDFDAEQAALLAALQRFHDLGPDGLGTARHPFFGPMTPDDWDLLMWKHLDHHLRQFGA